MIENPPGVQETWVLSLDREDPLEKGMATYSSILDENSMDKGVLWVTVFKVAKNPMCLSN